MAMMPGMTNSTPCHNAAQSAVHQPADIRRKLLGFRPWQEHAVIQGMQEPRFGNPFLLLDEQPVHHGDLTCGPAKAQQSNLRPDTKRLV